MIPTLSSLVAMVVIITTRPLVANDDNVGVMTILGVQFTSLLRLSLLKNKIHEKTHFPMWCVWISRQHKVNVIWLSRHNTVILSQIGVFLCDFKVGYMSPVAIWCAGLLSLSCYSGPYYDETWWCYQMVLNARLYHYFIFRCPTVICYVWVVGDWIVSL